jgi:hypothetical protein
VEGVVCRRVAKEVKESERSVLACFESECCVC